MTESVENVGRKNVGAEEDEFCCGGGVKPDDGRARISPGV